MSMMHGMMITMTPPIGGYTREQCEEDALASGLEPAALYAQVHELCGSRMKDETLDAMMKAHGIDVRGLSKIDKARILVGVTVQPPQPSPVLSSAGASPKSSSPVHSPKKIHSPKALSPTAVAAKGSTLPPPMLSASSSYLGSSRALLRAERDPSTSGPPPTLENPCESGPFRRRISHLSAAVQPLVGPLAMGATAMIGGGATGLAVAQGAAAVGAAGVAAVGGLSASVTTHEHHAQTQEMSRRLQRAAMEQDRKHHTETQGLSAQLQAQAMAQEARQHRQGLWREQQQHESSLYHGARLHEDSLRVNHRLHFEGILATLREQDREADHDLWEQRTERFQMLMTVSGLLISGGFALAVEGQLPTEPGCWDLAGSATSNCSATGRAVMVEVAAVHYVLLAAGLGLQLCVVMGCLALTGRFAEFMDLRVQKQQLLNKDLRRAAVKMIGDVDMRSAIDDRETIRKFEKVLRQQYVIETCDAGSPSRHVWNFNDWFQQRCAMLSHFVEVCFRLGMFSMISSIMTFEFAHLERGDAEVSVQSTAAWRGFAFTLGTLIVVAILVPQLVGSSWSWRFRRDGIRGLRRRPRHGGGSEGWMGWLSTCVRQCFRQITAPHKPVRFDIHHIAAQAEELFNEIDADGNGLLSEVELKAAAKKARENAARTRAEASSAANRLTPEMRRRAHSEHRGGRGTPNSLGEVSLPMSPHEGEMRRRNKEEEAAATAVLETIIRRLSVRAEKRRQAGSGDRSPERSPGNSLRRGQSGQANGNGNATANGPSNASSPASTPTNECSAGLSRVMRVSKRRLSKVTKPLAYRREYEVTKEEWDEAISDALF